MIDDFSILVSTLACLFIIWRAARLDREMPWFPAPRDEPGAPPLAQSVEPAWVPDWETHNSGMGER